jgi:hypothetical protein
MAARKEPDQKLVSLAFRIKPVMEGPDGALHFIKPADIYRAELQADTVKLIAAPGELEELRQVRMELPAGLRSFFGPTAAQALSNIPKDLVRKATAFRIEIDPGAYSGEEGYVNATATFYKGKLPKAVQEQPVIAMGKRFSAPDGTGTKTQFNPAAHPMALKKDIAVLKPLVFKKPQAGPTP